MSTKQLLNDQISLLDAISNNDKETVQFLIFGHEVCPNFVLNGQSPVVVAATNGREDVLDILIQSHCDLSTPDFSDNTWRMHSIHIAAAKGYIGFVRKLIDNGVSINSLDIEQKTPLHWAASYGHTLVIEYLISAGANVNATQVDGFTPLHYTVALNQNEACELLLANSADPNITDENGWTSIHHAVAYGHFSIIKTLHKAGASLTVKTPVNDNVLHIAACTAGNNKVELLHFLVENKVPLNEKDGCGNTPLHIACLHNIYDNVKCLIQLGSKLHTKNDHEDSLLFSAACAYDGHEIVSLLIKSGYNCSQETWIHDGRFPLALASNINLVLELKFHASNPRSLQELCCFSILKCLHIHSNDKINILPIPTALKVFIRNILLPV